MDIKKYSERIIELTKKYRYLVLILVIGIVMMLIPSKNKAQDTTDSIKDGIMINTYQDITQELTQVLSQMQGVGQVKVMLTISVGEQTIYQVDENSSSNDSGASVQKETVIITGTDRIEQPVVSYVKPPTYLGAIIVCHGADQPAVKLAVMDAVSKITGLSSDKISVVKMK